MKMTQFAKFANKATEQILGVTCLQRENLSDMFSSSISKEAIKKNPYLLQKVVEMGEISRYLKIGDIIEIPWTDNNDVLPIVYQYPFVVVNIDNVYDENNVKHENALWLMAMYATPKEITFDAPENTPVNLTEEPNAIEGWYYWGFDGSTYVALNLSAGQAIPTNYTSVAKCGINNADVRRYGYNRWRYSAYRQWLNSDAVKDEGWWSPQHLGDRPPESTQLNIPGWLNGFTEEWRAIFKPVKVETACNTVTDGGITDITYDTFFLPSIEQMYGQPEVPNVEGKYWQYWKEKTGLDAPSNGSSTNTNDARKIYSISNPTGSAVSCHLRSAYISRADATWFMFQTGFISVNFVRNPYRALPSCVIY